MLKSLRLSGPSVVAKTVPSACLACGCKDLYQQADFKRSVGVGLMIFVTIVCTVLFAMDYNWFLVWSPMLALLFVDLFLRKITPLAAICYDCGTVHRGVQSADLAQLPSFDLETFDRIQYKKTEQTES
jgi:hypothetical protein